MSDKNSCKNKISTANYCLLAQESVTTGKRRERRVAKTEELNNRQSSLHIHHHGVHFIFKERKKNSESSQSY